MANSCNYFYFVQCQPVLLKLMPKVHISTGFLKVHALLFVPFLLTDEPLDALLLSLIEIPQNDLCRGIVDPALISGLCKLRITCLISRQW